MKRLLLKVTIHRNQGQLVILGILRYWDTRILGKLEILEFQGFFCFILFLCFFNVEEFSICQVFP